MRLNRTLATGIACAVSLAVAGPAQAKAGNGHGKVQRCESAQNGKHNGFTCTTSTGAQVRGRCADGYFAAAAAFDPAADVNGNGVVCQSFAGESWVDDLAR
ncbi:MAG: hypothetical protein M3340_15565 [Actinomycetota bacterium]|nr:hypothetical protein [Actinomycetota bacterium]